MNSNCEMRADGLHRLRIIRAIMLRELRSRYSGDGVGYLWSLIIPLFWILLIYAFFAVFHRRIPIDTDMGSFILSGVVPYIAFRYTLTAVMRAGVSFRNLYVVPRVNWRIVSFSVGILELTNTAVIYALIAFGNWLLFGYFELENLFLLASGLVLGCLLGSSLAYMTISLVPNGQFAQRAMQVVARPMFYLSGVFYIASELPSAMQEWLYYNPLLHAVEITRTGALGSFNSQFLNAWVPLAYSAAFILAGSLVRSKGGTDSPNLEESLV